MSTTNGGLTFSGALQIALICLKLFGVIKCSWFIVLLPIELFIFIMTLAVIFIILGMR